MGVGISFCMMFLMKQSCCSVSVQPVLWRAHHCTWWGKRELQMSREIETEFTILWEQVVCASSYTSNVLHAINSPTSFPNYTHESCKDELWKWWQWCMRLNTSVTYIQCYTDSIVVLVSLPFPLLSFPFIPFFFFFFDTFLYISFCAEFWNA